MPTPPEEKNVRMFIKSVLWLLAIIGWLCLVLTLLWHLSVFCAIAVVAGVFGATLVIASLIWHFSGRRHKTDIDIDRFLKQYERTDSPRQSEADCLGPDDGTSDKMDCQGNGDGTIYH